MTLIRFSEHNPIGQIDRENGIIYGVSVITSGREATGHGMYVDQKMIEQVNEFGQAAGEVGVKARFDHPNPCASSMGTELGRFKNFRIDGNQVRADLHLNESSAKSPNGNYREYVLSLAEEDPDQFATSIVFRPDEDYIPNREDYPGESQEDSNPFWMPHARVASLTHVDVVNEGAANDGLFSNGVEMEYVKLKAKQFMKDHADIIKPALESVVQQYFKENPITHTKMAEEKKGFFERLFGASTKEEATQVAEEMETQLSEKSEELTSLQSKVEELESQLSSTKEALEEAKLSSEQAKAAFDAEKAGLEAELAVFKAADISDDKGEDDSPEEVIETETKLSGHDKNAEALKNRKR